MAVTRQTREKYYADKAAGICVSTGCSVLVVTGVRCEDCRRKYNTRHRIYNRKYPERIAFRWQTYYVENLEKETERTRIKNIGRKTRQKSQAVSRKLKYGLTEAQTWAILELQEYCCAVCWEPLTANFHIDHNHITQVNRGITHPNCNWGIGQFNDDPNKLRLAADYLERTSANENFICG